MGNVKHIQDIFKNNLLGSYMSAINNKLKWVVKESSLQSTDTHAPHGSYSSPDKESTKLWFFNQLKASKTT